MPRLQITLASIVTGVWLVDYVIAYVTDGKTHDGLLGLMGIVLGWVFVDRGRDIRRRNGNGNGNGK